MGSRALVNGWPLVSGQAGAPAPVVPVQLSISGANGTAAVGDTASFTPTISGGTAPYSVAATGLPPGRAINNAATGLTTGAYTTAGSYSATYTVTDAVGATASFTRTVVVSAASTVLPAANWRVPVSAVTATGTTADSANQTALLASPTNKDLPSVQVAASGTAVITWTVGQIAAPGGIVYLTTSVGDPAKRTLSAAYSTDGFATSTAIPYAPSQTISGTNNADDLIDIPAMPANAQLRLSYANTDAQPHAFRLQINQLQTDPLANDIYPVVGMSITTSAAGGKLADFVRPRFPGRDPIFVTVARSGAKPSNYLAEQMPILAARSYLKRPLVDLGVNDRVSGSAQWSSLSTAQQNQIKSDAAAISTWGTNNNRALTYVGTTFVNPGTYNGETYTVNQEGVVENGASTPIANQDNGMRPYIINAYSPVLKGLGGASWNAALDTAANDGYMPTLMSWDAWKQTVNALPVQDGVHAGSLANSIYFIGFSDAYAAAIGSAASHYLVRKIVAAEEKGITSAMRNRLYLGLLSLPPTGDSAAQAARSALQTRIGNISASYVEASGQTAPTALPGVVASFDFDDPSKIFSDNAASIPVKDYELAIVAQDKTANGFKLANTTARGAGNFVQPKWLLGEAKSQRGLLFDGTFATINSADAALVGALDAASAPFIIGWTDLGMQPGLRPSFAFLAGGTNRILARTQSNGMATQIVGQSSVIGTEGSAPAVGSNNVYVLAYDGTTLKLRRNGVETLSVAYSKPAWTGDTLRLGGAASGSLFSGVKRGWHLITGAWTGATLAALENRLLAQLNPQ